MKTIALVFLLVLYAQNVGAADVNLAWDPHPDPGLQHYTLYQADQFKDATGPWQRVKEIDKALTTTTVTVQDGKNFAWYLTASGTDKDESGPSNAVQLYERERTERPACLTIP